MIYSSLRIYLALLCLLYAFIFIESVKMCIMLFKEIFCLIVMNSGSYSA